MNNNIIYFDNAATSWPKPEQVYNRVDTVLRTIGGNPGRGSHSSSIIGNNMINNARKEIAAFFNIPSPNYVIFTHNGTDSLNIVLKGLIKSGDRVLVTPFEHNSVMRPLNRFKNFGVHIETVKTNDDFSISLDSVQKLCQNGIVFVLNLMKLKNHHLFLLFLYELQNF